jgi:ketosteroid isomerase-like protein
MINRFIVLVGLLMAVFIQATAQTTKNNNPLDELVQAERNFAQTATQKGIQPAFVQFLAEDGIIFTPLSTRGKKYHQENPNPPAGLLTWEPTWAEVSAAGDLGYTTGPYEYRQQATDEKPVGTGHYMSIWRKGTDGIWQVVVDMGINHPPLPAKALLKTPPDTKPAKEKKEQNISTIREAEARILAAEKSFSEIAQSSGTQAAYTAFLAPVSRLYREQHAPYIGKKDALAALALNKNTFTSQPAFSAVAASGDLGYTYGTNQINATHPGEEKQVFTRIWQKQPDNSWKLVLDVTKPLPPAKKE